MKNLEESILKVVNAKGYRPLKPRKIADQLGLSKDEAVEVRRVVKRLVRRRQAPLRLEPSCVACRRGVRGQGSGVRRGERGERCPHPNPLPKGEGTAGRHPAQRERGPRDGTLARRERGPRDGTLARTERGPRDGTLARTERGPRDEPDDPLTRPSPKGEGTAGARRQPGAGRFSADAKGIRVRPPPRRADDRRKGRKGQENRHLHSRRSHGRCRHRRRGAGRGRPPRPRRAGTARGRLSRWSNGKPGSSSAPTWSRPGRPTCASTARCLPGRSTSAIRREKRPARRQSGRRDAALPLARQGRRRRDYRGAWPAGAAGRRYALDHPRVRPARPVRRRRPGGGPARRPRPSTNRSATGST